MEQRRRDRFQRIVRFVELGEQACSRDSQGGDELVKGATPFQELFQEILAGRIVQEGEFLEADEGGFEDEREFPGRLGAGAGEGGMVVGDVGVAGAEDAREVLPEEVVLDEGSQAVRAELEDGGVGGGVGGGGMRMEPLQTPKSTVSLRRGGNSEQRTFAAWGR